MRFRGLDLNLLVAFEALLEERSVRRAAEKLRLSQPATSSALARLRAFFDDPILVVQGKRMYSTPYADSLLPQVKDCLRVAASLIASSSGFDPATSHRVFRVVTSDYIIAALFSSMIRSLASLAPNIGFEFVLPDELAMVKLERGNVDVMISPSEFGDESYLSENLFDETHVVVGCRTNPLFERELTEQQFLESGHVAVAVGAASTPAFGDRQLSALGKNRRIELKAASFAVIPWLVMGTSRLAVMHERLALTMARSLPIAIAPMPFPFPAMREIAQYHRSRTGDEGLRWLISQLKLEADRNRPGN